MAKRKTDGARSPEARLWAAMNELHLRVWYLELPWWRKLIVRHRARKAQEAAGRRS